MCVHLHIFQNCPFLRLENKKMLVCCILVSWPRILCILCILFVFIQVKSSLFYAASSYSCYMGQPINSEHFKLLHLKKMLSGDSLFDGSCLHHLYVYCVNIGQDQ